MRKWPSLIILTLTAIGRADVITLNDGSRMEGDLKRADSGWTITTADGKVHTVAANAVKSVQLNSSTTRSASQAAEALASLRRSSDGVTDINQIIERYRHFIEANKDAPVVADARADLAIWQQRRDDGFVRHASKWMSQADMSAMIEKSSLLVGLARDQLIAGHAREADQLLQRAFDADPGNAAAQYLRGLSFYRLEKPIDARKAFDTANTINPSHAPTLNNLAVVYWRVKQTAAALNYYEQAMLAGGVNQAILDNVADALGSSPDELRKGTPYTKCLKRFGELEPILQRQMAEKSLYRWGDSWIDQTALDKLKAAEKEVRDRLKEIQTEADKNGQRIKQIDGELLQNQRIMNDMSSNRRMLRDGSGNLVATPLPDTYYELDRRNGQLAAEQDSLRQMQATLQQQMQATQQLAPVPTFSGVQHLIGIEGMPSSGAPTTQPGQQ